MKKYIVILLCFNFLILSGCSWADKIEEGTYICTTPYIKCIYDSSLGYNPTAEIEIDRTVYKTFTRIGYDGTISFIEFQEEDVNPTDGWYTEDNETYARFDYKFDSEKKQLILTDMDNGNVYHLDKVE